MKTLTRVLAVLFILNAVMILFGQLLQGGVFQSSTFNILALLAVPVSLLGVGFLQWTRPSAALLVLSVAVFPYCCIVCHAFMLPIWPVLRIFPREAGPIGLFAGNAVAVATSLLIWIGIRKTTRTTNGTGPSKARGAPHWSG